MKWNLSFITQEDCVHHVRETIRKYGDKLDPFDLKRLNRNQLDPIKLIFDKLVYQSSWKELIRNEVFRQRDALNSNDAMYFHQRLFQYVRNCDVPENCDQGGWSVIYRNLRGIRLPGGNVVHTVYVTMKNKHNTMNSMASGKLFIKMQDQLLKDNDCACFLVEAIAKKSQDIQWRSMIGGRLVGHDRLRRVSLDRFYAMVTGEEDAFYQLCVALPDVIQEALAGDGANLAPKDTAFEELTQISKRWRNENENVAIGMAIYLLGFSTYTGFKGEVDVDA